MRVTGNEWDFFAIRDNLTVFDHSASGRICDAIRENFTFFLSFCLRTVFEKLFKSSYKDIKLMLTEMPEWCGFKRKSYK